MLRRLLLACVVLAAAAGPASAADVTTFAYGNARFLGSAGGLSLAQPIVGMTPTLDGGGYSLLAADGATLSFGDAMSA